jgi:hypothetical protein
VCASQWLRSGTCARPDHYECLSECSALQKEDGSFCPAHALADGRMERAGRAGKADLARPSAGATLTKSAGVVVVGDEILAAKVRHLGSVRQRLGYMTKVYMRSKSGMHNVCRTMRSVLGSCQA